MKGTLLKLKRFHHIIRTKVAQLEVELRNARRVRPPQTKTKEIALSGIGVVRNSQKSVQSGANGKTVTRAAAGTTTIASSAPLAKRNKK